MKNLRFHQIIPCALHIMLNIVKKLVAVSVQLINNSKPLVTEFVALWKKMGVFLAKEEDDLVPDDEGAVRVPLYRSISLCNLAEEEKQ